MILAVAQAQRAVDFTLDRKFEELILLAFPLRALAVYAEAFSFLPHDLAGQP